MIIRDCTDSNLVRDFATFHIFFDFDHTPDQVWKFLLAAFLFSELYAQHIFLRSYHQIIFTGPTLAIFA